MPEIDLGLVVGEQGEPGTPGANATINGFQAVTIEGGKNVNIDQSTPGKLVINVTTSSDPGGGGDYIPTSEKGAPNGVATLGDDGKVPEEQLPSNIPTTGGDGKIPADKLPDDVITTDESGKIPADKLPESAVTTDSDGKIPSDKLPEEVVTTDSSGKIPEEKLPEKVVTTDSSGKIPEEKLPEKVVTTDSSGKIPEDKLPETISEAISGMNTHIANKQNPHNVTAAQVGSYTKDESLSSSVISLLGLGSGATPSQAIEKLKSLIDSANTNVSSKAEIVVGSYTGNDNAKRKIILEFTPSAVFVECTTGYRTKLSTGIGSYDEVVGGFCISGNKADTVSIVSNGFEVYCASSSTHMTNSSVFKYNYIAFK